MSRSRELLVAFHGDDFTGSTDALEFLARAGLRGVLFLEPPDPRELESHGELDAYGVAGHTRSLATAEIDAAVRPVLDALRAHGPRVIHHKICSTFDSSPEIGSIGRVIDTAAEIFAPRVIPLLAGAPPLGRYSVFGNLFARSGLESEPYRLDRHPTMRCHPVTPMDEADLRVHLARQTDREVRLLDILAIAAPLEEAVRRLEDVLEGAPRGTILLLDVLEDRNLGTIGRLIEALAENEPGPLFTVGSSAIEMALTVAWRDSGRIRARPSFPDPEPATPIVVASGSCSPVTERQLRDAFERGFVPVALDVALLIHGDGDATDRVARRAALSALEALQSERSVAIYSALGPKDADAEAGKERLQRLAQERPAGSSTTRERIGRALGRALRTVLEESGVRRVGVAGGDTSGLVARELAIRSLEIVRPLAPGSPLCRASAPGEGADGVEFCFKGGQVGTVDFFEKLRRGGER